MGSLLSRFRKKPTTEEQLKKIEDGLRKIEDYKRSTERKHKKLIASIIIYSAALYILACVIVFVWYLPESWLIRLGLLIPLVLVPVIVYLLKRLISKYFDSRMVKANEEYADLQRKKKDIIDSVMETETFNKAKEILSKYAPEKLDKKEQPPSPRVPVVPVVPAEGLRQRNSAQVAVAPTRTQSDPVTTLVKVPRRDLSPVSPIRPGTAPKQRLPQPVFPKERGITDKLIEFMIGDGPGYRYALICKHCRGHNGMAMKEEFPYMAFNCCYCYQYNPARSKRPVPPKLPDIKELPVGSASTPALPAPAVKSEPSQGEARIREETKRVILDRCKDFNFEEFKLVKSQKGNFRTVMVPTLKYNARIGNEDDDTSKIPSESVIDNDDSFPKPVKFDQFMKMLDENKEEDKLAETTEIADVNAESAESLEADTNDLKINKESETEDINEEKSDDDFQKLGFVDSDFELLREVDPQPHGPGGETQGSSDDKET